MLEDLPSKLTFSFHDDLNNVSHDWDFAEESNQYWSSKYLNALNGNPPTGVRSHFCLVKENDRPVAKFLFQYLTIKLSESFGDPSGEQKKPGFFQSLLRGLILPFLNFKIVVNGNLLLSGSYGFKFVNGLDFKTKQTIFDTALAQYRLFLKSKKLKASGILLKDLDNPNHSLDPYLAENAYTHFKVQPKMKFLVKDEWKSIDDYSSDLKSKYRVRYKKAKKCLGTIRRVRLQGDLLLKHCAEMNELYKQTVATAGFNLFYLNETYFSTLGRKLPDTFEVYGLFKEDKMVAFYTLMDNGDEFDAHYLGYDQSLNYKHKLYLNMLYFMVEDAIDAQKKRLHMSRTALEIKSSVGTIPEEVQLYAKFYGKIGNWLLPKILDLTVPKLDWQPRHPFK